MNKIGNGISFFIIHLSLVFLFAGIYWILHSYVTKHKALVSSHKKPEDITLFDCFYFSMVTQTSVGYGDILTIHPIARTANIMQLLSVYGVITYGLLG